MSEIYLGNPNLKKANTQIEFTKENVAEYLKCKDNKNQLDFCDDLIV